MGLYTIKQSLKPNSHESPKTKQPIYLYRLCHIWNNGSGYICTNFNICIMSHYNTTNLEGKELQSAENKAQALEKKILAFFREFPQSGFTPWDVLAYCCKDKNLIGSVRRAMTNLTTKEQLRKTDVRIMGKAGASNYTWKLNKQ